jgi:hypothetical protein
VLGILAKLATSSLQEGCKRICVPSSDLSDGLVLDMTGISILEVDAK